MFHSMFCVPIFFYEIKCVHPFIRKIRKIKVPYGKLSLILINSNESPSTRTH